VEPGTDPEWRRGVFPPPSAIRPDRPLEAPPTAEQKAAFAAKVTATCPPGTAEDPLPGLSPAARSIKPSRHHQYRSLPMLQEEIKLLLQMLGKMAMADPDRPKVLDRLASNYFVDERDNYRDCMDLLIMVEADRFPLSELEARLRADRERFERARAHGMATCAKIAAEHPSYKPNGLCAALP